MISEDPPQQEFRFDPSDLDERSYYLGMIYAFAEVVASGCKKLALSPALTPEQLEYIWEDSVLIVREYDILLEIDEDFLTTRLFNPEYTDGKIVIHIAAERRTLDEYKRLKKLKERRLSEGKLDEEAELELAWGLGKLLSYSDAAIKALLEKPRF
ncbi:MAG: hypothetical protein PVH79_02235 [Candidatus Bathyarchaeota archaeon]|jgi:hypothetical protein